MVGPAEECRTLGYGLVGVVELHVDPREGLRYVLSYLGHPGRPSDQEQGVDVGFRESFGVESPLDDVDRSLDKRFGGRIEFASGDIVGDLLPAHADGSPGGFGCGQSFLEGL